MSSVNTDRDAGAYGQSGYLRDDIFDGNNLYDAMCKARKNSDWKGSVQKFCMDWLINLSKIQQEGYDYQFGSTYRFKLCERGKTRLIDGERFSDRVVTHSICDNVLNPAVFRKIIYDNCASIPDKGIGMTRRRLVTHLSRHYRKTGSNGGYILMADFRKYYDNVRFDYLMNRFAGVVEDPRVLNLIARSIDRSKIDVSYMSDDQYRRCYDEIFDSIAYQRIPKRLLTGQKYMYKHLNVGNQLSQTAGIFYPTMIDQYIKTVRGFKGYARYNDDFYVIGESKEELQKLLEEIKRMAPYAGVFINEAKTQIVPLKSHWRFLQIQYSLTDAGRIVQKINPKRLTCMRRKMKNLAGVLSHDEFENLFKGWFSGHKKYMARQQKKNMKTLYSELERKFYGKTHPARRKRNRESASQRNQLCQRDKNR